MKSEHTKNIKKFIKKYKSVLKLPFMKKFSSEPSVEATGKPIVQILRNLDLIPEEDNTGIAKLAAKYDPNAKVSGGFGKSPVVTILNSGNKKEAALTGEVKGDGPETIVRSLSGQSDSVIPHSYLKPTDTPRVMSSSNKLISLPKTDVKKLVDLSLTKQITNKITKTKNNEYTLNIPEYGIGKNILSGLMKVAAKATPVISKAATKFGSALNKKLSPLTDALKSAKNMGMSLLEEEKRNEPSSAPTATVAAEPQSTPVMPPDPPTPHVASKEFPSQDVDGNPVSAEQHKAALDNSLHIAGGGEAGAARREQIRAADNVLLGAQGKPLIEPNATITPEQISKNKEIINTIPGMAAAPAAAAPSAAAAAAAAAAPAAAPVAAPAAAPVAASGSISAVSETPKDAPTKIEGGYGSGVGPGTSADELKAQAESAQAALPEQEAPGTGASRGIAAIGEAVSMAAQVAATVALPGVGGAAMGALKGVASMAGGAGKIAGGLGKAGKVLGAVSGGEGGGGGGGGGVGAAGGGGGGMGVPGGAMSSVLGAVGVAAVGGGALAAVGGIAAGVGGVAAGIGAAVGGIAGAYATVGGKLIDAVFGSSKKDEKPPVNNIMNDSRSTTTVVNSVSNQYDIYRKTADDSFMLPNHRREYG